MKIVSTFVLLLLLNVASAGTLARGIQPESSSASMYRLIDHFVSKADTEKLCIVRQELQSKQNSQEPVIDIIAYLDNKAAEKLGFSPLKCDRDSLMIDMDKNKDTLVNSGSDYADLNPTQDEAGQVLSDDFNATQAMMSANETLKVFKSIENYLQADATVEEAKSDQDFNFIDADIPSPEENSCQNCSEDDPRLNKAGISPTFNDDDQLEHDNEQKLQLILISVGGICGLLILIILLTFGIIVCCKLTKKRKNRGNAEIPPVEQDQFSY